MSEYISEYSIDELLIFAAIRGDIFSLENLIAQGANVNTGYLDVVNYILECGADISGKNHSTVELLKRARALE